MNAVSLLAGALCVAGGVILGLAYRLRQWRGLALREQDQNRHWEAAFDDWQKDVARFNSASMPQPKKPTFKIEAGK